MTAHLVRQHDNLRAALAFAIAQRDFEMAMRLAGRSIDFRQRMAISRRDVAGSSLDSNLTLANHHSEGARFWDWG